PLPALPALHPLSLHDALPICGHELALFFYDGPVSRAVAFENLLEDGRRLAARLLSVFDDAREGARLVHIATDGESYGHHRRFGEDRKSTRLNSSHDQISYAVF